MVREADMDMNRNGLFNVKWCKDEEMKAQFTQK